MTLADATFYLFSFFNALRIFSYLPQIHRVAADQNGAAAISYWTWVLWAMSNASTAAYALVCLGDLPLAAISAINTACCSVVIGLTAFKRYQIRQNKRPMTGAKPVVARTFQVRAGMIDRARATPLTRRPTGGHADGSGGIIDSKNGAVRHATPAATERCRVFHRT